MPIYEYECAQCGERTEVLQRLGDPAPAACSHCGSSELSRAVSAPAFQFKGTGWYVTDYADKGGSRSKEEGSEGAKESSSGSDEKKASPSDSEPSKAAAAKNDG